MKDSTIEFVWHARRFWVQEPREDQHQGWNTRFEPCFILKRTVKRVQILSPSFGKMLLDRVTLERDGKVYHSKPHEWFYAEHPKVDPEKPRPRKTPDLLSALSVLELPFGSTQKDIKKAYKRLARKLHPDAGGSGPAFMKLRAAYETALRFHTV